jgi:hypothetical protein
VKALKAGVYTLLIENRATWRAEVSCPVGCMICQGPHDVGDIAVWEGVDT